MWVNIAGLGIAFQTVFINFFTVPQEFNLIPVSLIYSLSVGSRLKKKGQEEKIRLVLSGDPVDTIFK